VLDSSNIHLTSKAPLEPQANIRRVSGEEFDRPRTEEEWKKIRKSWEADHAENTRALKLIQRDYKPGSTKHKKIDEVMKREKAELELILKTIDVVRSMDKTLHPSDTAPNGPTPEQRASGSILESKFCQFCGSRLPAPALYCPTCGKRQL
jgi:ribosomal protein L40E